MVFIGLEVVDESKLNNERDVVILADEKFQMRRQVITTPVCIVQKHNMFIAAMNMFDSAVTVKNTSK